MPPHVLASVYQTIIKEIRGGISPESVALAAFPDRKAAEQATEEDAAALILELETEMFKAAETLEFERAAELRDKIRELESGMEP